VSKEDIVKEYADKSLTGLKDRLGEKWDAFTDVQRASATRAAKRWVDLDIQERQGKDVSVEKQFVEVTIGEFEVAAKIAFVDIFWEEMNKALEALGSFLAGVGKGLIPGL